MKLSDIKWSNPERPPSGQTWLRTARLDTEHPLRAGFRAGMTVNVAWWPDTNEYRFVVQGMPRVGPLAFSALLKGYFCQVDYNEYGEF